MSRAQQLNQLKAVIFKKELNLVVQGRAVMEFQMKKNSNIEMVEIFFVLGNMKQSLQL